MIVFNKKNYKYFYKTDSLGYPFCSLLMGSSCNVIIENGKLKLGIWQNTCFCEIYGKVCMLKALT